MSKYLNILRQIEKIETEHKAWHGIYPPRAEIMKLVGIDKKVLKKMEIEGLIQAKTIPLVKTNKDTGQTINIGGHCLINLTETGRALVEAEIAKEKQAEIEANPNANPVLSVEDLIRQSKSDNQENQVLGDLNNTEGVSL